MESQDLLSQGIGPAELREDDIERANANEIEWAIMRMTQAINQWDTATQKINAAFSLMQDAQKHLLGILENARREQLLNPAAQQRVSDLVKLMHHKILCHEKAVTAAAGKQLYGLKPLAKIVADHKSK